MKDFPQITQAFAAGILKEYAKDVGSMKSLADICAHLERHVNYGAEGGDVVSQIFYRGTERVSVEELKNMRDAVLLVAKAHGYPDAKPKRPYEADVALGKAVASAASNSMSLYEAFQDGTWYFMHACLFPDIVWWRWANEKKEGDTESAQWSVNDERLLGIAGARGALSGPYHRWLLFTVNGKLEYPKWADHLTQDAAGGVMERTSMRGYTEVILPFLKRAADLELRNEGAEGVIRIASKLLRVRTSVEAVFVLDTKEIEALVDEVYTLAEQQYTTVHAS